MSKVVREDECRRNSRMTLNSVPTLRSTSAPSPVYGESNITLSYRCLDLIWRPAARMVRFVIVRQGLGQLLRPA
jgi:hypothetical protein